VRQFLEKFVSWKIFSRDKSRKWQSKTTEMSGKGCTSWHMREDKL